MRKFRALRTATVFAGGGDSGSHRGLGDQVGSRSSQPCFAGKTDSLRPESGEDSLVATAWRMPAPIQIARDGGTLREALLADADVRRHVAVEQIEEVMNPATYLGSAQSFIDRALTLHRASMSDQ